MFFGIRESRLAEIMVTVRTENADRLIDVDFDASELPPTVSYLRDGTIFGPAEYFRAVDRVAV
jgi:hypothetical protein